MKTILDKSRYDIYAKIIPKYILFSGQFSPYYLRSLNDISFLQAKMVRGESFKYFKDQITYNFPLAQRIVIQKLLKELKLI